MKRACIAIVDGSSARIYTHQQRDGAPPALHEERELVNRRRRATDPHARDAPDAHDAHDAPDAHDAHDAHDAPDARDAEFAGRVIDEVERIVRDACIDHVILVASPMMTGHLRLRDGQLTRRGITVDEIVRDLARLTAAQGPDHRAVLDGIGRIPPVAVERG